MPGNESSGAETRRSQRPVVTGSLPSEGRYGVARDGATRSAACVPQSAFREWRNRAKIMSVNPFRSGEAVTGDFTNLFQVNGDARAASRCLEPSVEQLLGA